MDPKIQECFAWDMAAYFVTAENQHEITSQAILEKTFSAINSVIKLGVQTTQQLLLKGVNGSFLINNLSLLIIKLILLK